MSKIERRWGLILFLMVFSIIAGIMYDCKFPATAWSIWIVLVAMCAVVPDLTEGDDV